MTKEQPMMISVQEIVRHRRHANIDVNFQAGLGFLLLHSTVKTRNDLLVGMYLATDIDIFGCDTCGRTDLHRAAREGLETNSTPTHPQGR